jgi:hypothetical protein
MAKYFLLCLLLPGCYAAENVELRETNRVVNIKYRAVAKEADLAEARLTEMMAELNKHPNAYCPCTCK